MGLRPKRNDGAVGTSGSRLEYCRGTADGLSGLHTRLVERAEGCASGSVVNRIGQSTDVCDTIREFMRQGCDQDGDPQLHFDGATRTRCNRRFVTH
jgi:hypothetical protein